MANFLLRFFHIPLHQQVLFRLLFAFAFTTAASYVVSRSVADSLFLSRIGPEKLPWMYFVAAIFVGFVAMVYARLSALFPLHQIFRFTLLLLCLSTISLPFFLSVYPHTLLLLGCLYLLTQIRGAIGTIQLTTLMNEVFTKKPPARIVGLVGFGSTLAGMILGGLIGAEADDLGTVNLLYLVAGLDFVGIFLVRNLANVIRSSQPEIEFESEDVDDSEIELTPEELQTSNEPPWKTVLKSPLAICIAVMVCTQTVTLTLVEFQWKVSAHNAYQVEGPPMMDLEHEQGENRLTAYFGKYYAVIYGLTGILQLFVTGGYLSRWGLLPALLIFPSALAAANVGILLASPTSALLGATTIAKGCESLRRGLYDAALYLLYWPMDHLKRRRAIAFSVGLAKPGSEAITGLVILQLVHFFPLRSLSYFIIGLLGAWTLLAGIAYRRYLALGGKKNLADTIPSESIVE